MQHHVHMWPIATDLPWSASVSLLDITMSCAKMAESIAMLFGVWTRVGQRNHILRNPPRERAILGTCPNPLRSIGNIRRERKLFTRCQH